MIEDFQIPFDSDFSLSDLMELKKTGGKHFDFDRFEDYQQLQDVDHQLVLLLDEETRMIVLVMDGADPDSKMPLYTPTIEEEDELKRLGW